MSHAAAPAAARATSMTASQVDALFKPPVNRSMQQLDRDFFSREIPTSAARVHDSRHISRLRAELERSGALLLRDRIKAVRPDPDQAIAAKGGRCLLLRREIKHDDASTWDDVLRENVQRKSLDVIPYTLKLGYDDWSYQDILGAVLPEEYIDSMPTGYNIAGHIAHFNLRAHLLPYKSLIATVLLDKNPALKTVINKTGDVGARSEYRTFPFELLAGEPRMEVQARVGELVFHFDYSKVYWNSKLSQEHDRLVELFRPGEAVCDVMAGVGPFTVRAAKRGVFVWANDLNPDCYTYMEEAVRRNKVQDFVRTCNEDGHRFIQMAVDDLLHLQSEHISVRRLVKTPAAAPLPGEKPTAGQQQQQQQQRRRPPGTVKTYRLPPTFSHFIMNLPASAIDFLGRFRGVYRGHEQLFRPHTATPLPMVHAYCFTHEPGEVWRRISDAIRCEIAPDAADAEIRYVRNVSTGKDMYCASFRLPPEVAFASSSSSSSSPSSSSSSSSS